jgi:hypothetical protein
MLPLFSGLSAFAGCEVFFPKRFWRLHLFRTPEEPRREIPGSARHEHDKKREKPVGDPPSKRKNFEMPSPVPSTPREKSG